MNGERLALNRGEMESSMRRSLRLAVMVVAASCVSAQIGAQTNPLWSEQKVKNFLPHMTWPDVRDLLTRSDMVLIPIPALEQHGFHGPIGTDYYSGVEQSKLIALRTDILVAPILFVGQSPYHLAFPGSIALSAETLQRVYFEAAQSLINQGFKRILLYGQSRARYAERTAGALGVAGAGRHRRSRGDAGVPRRSPQTEGHRQGHVDR